MKVKKDVPNNTWIIKTIDLINSKFKNKFLLNISYVMLMLIFVFFGFGFYIFPFITYGNLAMKIAFTVCWSISAIIMFNSIFANLKKLDLIEKWSRISTYWILFITFLIALVSNNYFEKLSWYYFLVIPLAVLALSTTAFILFNAYKSNKKVFSCSMIYALIIVTSSILLILGTSGEITNQVVNDAFILIGGFFIAAVVVSYMSSILLKNNSTKSIYSYTVGFIVVCLLLGFIAYIVNLIDDDVKIVPTFIMLFAATLGGGITLLGVYLSINHNNKQKRQDDIDKAKPYMNVVTVSADVNHAGNIVRNDFEEVDIVSKNADESNKPIRFTPFDIKLISNNIIRFVGVDYNGILCKCTKEWLFAKDDLVRINLPENLINSADDEDELNFIVADIFNYHYSLKLKYESQIKGNYSVKSIGLPVKYDIVKVKKEIEEYTKDYEVSEVPVLVVAEEVPVANEVVSIVKTEEVVVADDVSVTEE